jgi:hypothetical protein
MNNCVFHNNNTCKRNGYKNIRRKKTFVKQNAADKKRRVEFGLPSQWRW